MSRRTTGLVLLGVGAFAVVAALALRLVLLPSLFTLPADPQGESVATGTGVTWFDQGALTERTGATVRSGREVVGDANAVGATDSVAVWEATTATTAADGSLIDVSIDRLCLDRRTALAVQPCAAEFLAGVADVRHEGLSYTFPIGTEQREYPFFDTRALKAFPARFVGEEEVAGLRVYRFEQTVPETVIGRRDVPGELAGAAQGTTVAAERVYTNTRTLWVEPTSGVVVRGQEQQRQVLRGPGGTEGVTLFGGTLAFDEATVGRNAAKAEDARDRIASARNLLGVVVPLALGAVGLIALVAGALLLRGAGSRGRHAGSDRPTAPVETSSRT